MSDFYIKRGDTSPAITGTVVDEDEVVISLVAATSVKFLMIDPGTGAAKVDAAATILDAVNGRVRYAWTGTDTDTAGKYNGEFEITWSDGTKTTFPNFKYIQIEVIKDIG